MDDLTTAQRVVAWVLPVLFAITVHEVAHGWVAKQLGDPTASRLGRLTVNPIRHIDPVGTLLVPGILLLLKAGFLFGWAKPVPVNWENLRRPKQDMALVAAAGPLANLLMAIGWVLLARVGLWLWTDVAWLAMPLVYMGVAGVFINLILMAINLLPIPPLDGGRVMVGMLPGVWAARLARLEPYGFIILLGLLFTGVLGAVLGPVIFGLQDFAHAAVGCEQACGIVFRSLIN